MPAAKAKIPVKKSKTKTEQELTPVQPVKNVKLKQEFTIDFVYKSGEVGGAMYVNGERAVLTTGEVLGGWDVLKAIGLKFKLHWLDPSMPLADIPQKFNKVCLDE